LIALVRDGVPQPAIRQDAEPREAQAMVVVIMETEAEPEAETLGQRGRRGGWNGRQGEQDRCGADRLFRRHFPTPKKESPGPSGAGTRRGRGEDLAAGTIRARTGTEARIRSCRRGARA